LNFHANECARTILQIHKLSDAAHDHAIHKLALVEAFPSSFLGVLIEDPDPLGATRAYRSDIFYCHLTEMGVLLALLQYLLPHRTVQTSFADVRHHDERAAVVCALTALCVAVGDYTVVGDKKDGWIVLPPRSFIRPWAWSMLKENAGQGGLEFRPV
jgi:hypothetical protein